jgi:putative flippase GtrA
VHTADPAPPHAAQTAQRPPRMRRWIRLIKAVLTSVFSTGVSQIALLGLLWFDAPVWVASSVAFVAGAIPNYLLSRHWAWGRHGRPDLRTETVPYLMVIGAGGLVSIGLTTLTGLLLTPLHMPHLAHVLVLDAAYIGSYGLVFLFKFALLDRFVFRAAPQTP